MLIEYTFRLLKLLAGWLLISQLTFAATPAEALNKLIQANNTIRASTESLAATFDTNSSILYLPIVSIDNSAYYQLRLQLTSNSPVLLELIEALPVSSSSQVSASYDSTSNILLINSIDINGKASKVELKRNTVLSGYYFELSSLTEINPFTWLIPTKPLVMTSMGLKLIVIIVVKMLPIAVINPVITIMAMVLFQI